MRGALASLLALSAIATGCGLGPIEPNVCGNGVVEPENHEDCDNTSALCGSKVSATPCRALCSSDNDCTPGSQCGTDHVCRRPIGAFVEVSQAPTTGILGLSTGDINADGCDDLVTSTVSKEIIDGFESRSADKCVAFHETFRASLKLSDEPFAAPVVGKPGGASELVLVDKGELGEALFELDLIDNELVPRAHLGIPVRGNNATLGSALSVPMRLQDDSDAVMILAASPIPGGGMQPPPMEPRSLFGLRYPSMQAELIDSMLQLPALTMVTVATGDLEIGGCDELVYAISSSPILHVSSVCPKGAGDPGWDQKPLPDIALAGGAKLPALAAPTASPHAKVPPSSTSLVTIDADGDGTLDILVNDDSGHIHVAYGLGDGRFHSTSPPSAPPDQTTSLLASASDWGIDGDFVFAAWPGESPTSPAPHAILLPIACPTRSGFASPTCAKPQALACSVGVGDVDGNGLVDVVFTEPELPSFLVYRGTNAGGFALSSHDTTCPPQWMTVSDLDGDSLDDIALHDCKPGIEDAMGPTFDSIVKVAFGSPSAPPLAVSVVATFDPSLRRVAAGGPARLQNLVHGQFLTKEAGSQLATVLTIPASEEMGAAGDALAAARLEGAADRRMVAPIYFAGVAFNEPFHVQQMVRGQFAGFAGLAVVTRHGPAGMQDERLWLIDARAIAGAMAPPPRMIDCRGCVLAAVDLEGDGQDELLALGEGSIAIYRATSKGGFDEPKNIMTSFTFRGGDESVRKPRPVVADLDGDGKRDILMTTGSGQLVALWGTGTDELDVKKLLDPPPCPPEAMGSCTARPGFAVLEADGTDLPEVVVIAPGYLRIFDLGADRALHDSSVSLVTDVLRTPPPFSDFTAVVAGDFDGDGVDDLAMAFASSFFRIVRGIPSNE